MGYYTEYTTRWLDRRYARVDEQGRYYAHMPIYGLNHPCGEGGNLPRFARLHQLLRELNHLDFASCLDVGGGEGYVSHVIRETFGAQVVSCDLSVEACTRTWDLFRVDAVAIDSARLPFPDDAFDVVICSEVIEHVEYAVECLLELSRVAKKAVILSTEELEVDREEIARHLFRRCGYPHFERNLFHPDDLKLLFGDQIAMRSQFVDRVPTGDLSLDQAAEWISTSTDVAGIVPDGRGVVVRCELSKDARRDAPRRTEAELLESMLQRVQVADDPLQIVAREAASPAVIARSVCPLTHAALRQEGDALTTVSGRRYEVKNGIPILYDFSAPDPSEQDLRDRLAQTWPGDAARIEKVAALRHELVLPFDPDKLTWDFTDHEDRRGWMPAESLRELPDGFAFEATDDDPWIASPGLNLDAKSVRALTIRMRTFNPDYPVEGGVGQLFWMTDVDTTLEESRCITFPVRNEDATNDYRIELAGHEPWPTSGRVLFLRVDPANGPCRVELLGVNLEC